MTRSKPTGMGMGASTSAVKSSKLTRTVVGVAELQPVVTARDRDMCSHAMAHAIAPLLLVGFS
jgi:hypothetical protein